MILYLIKSGLYLAILLGFYLLFLEREKMHRFNRYFLLIALVSGLTIPLLSFQTSTKKLITDTPAYVINSVTARASTFIEDVVTETTKKADQEEESSLYVKPTFEMTSIQAKEPNFFPSLKEFLIAAYSLVTLILFGRMGIGIFSFYQKRKNNPFELYKSAKVVLLSEDAAPYTFLNSIYVNKHQYRSKEISNQILEHELTHVQQRHSLDVLFIEVIRIVFWFNPVFYFYKKAIQVNHEFLADESVITKTKDSISYQKLLLETVFPSYKTGLSSSFNYSLTKKRFKVMMKRHSFLKSSSKKAAVLTFLMAWGLMFCTDLTEPKLVHINGEEYQTFFGGAEFSEPLYFKTNELDRLRNSKSARKINALRHYNSRGELMTGTVSMTSYDGYLLSERVLQDGRALKITYYDSLGKELGRVEFDYDESGQIIHTKDFYRNNLRNEIIYPPLNNDSLTVYKNYYANGRLKNSYNSKSDKYPPVYHGIMTSYDEQGNILEQERYDNGKSIEVIKTRESE